MPMDWNAYCSHKPANLVAVQAMLGRPVEALATRLHLVSDKSDPASRQAQIEHYSQIILVAGALALISGLAGLMGMT